ncbi:MAG: M28 family peptidase [Candidatus Lokiarchaeota archaeon]|nr:M28 family peptidase [Candidatus Lokiarchaeota archaeon]
MQIQIPSKEEMMAWITEIFQQGIRRPGYPADIWVENWIREKLLDFNFDRVKFEPLNVQRWEAKNAKLIILLKDSTEDILEIPCFPIPYTKSTQGTEGEIRNIHNKDLKGKIALNRLNLIKLPTSSLKLLTNKYYDPKNEFDSLNQLMPFGMTFQYVLEEAIKADALGMIGYISNYPWETQDYYVPYNAVKKNIPGVWVSPKNGKKIAKLMKNHKLYAKITYDASNDVVETNNVYGILKGASDEWVIISTHHDGPWASATEDATGIALVLAQAKYWSQIPREKRPFNLLFLMNCAHMAGGKGGKVFVEKNKDLLEKVVVTIVLEHVARDCKSENGKLIPTDDPVVRWWFTSKIPILQDITEKAIQNENLYRSVIMPTEGFPPGSDHPPTDAAPFHLAGVPIVSLLSAPPYLFDPADTLDKVHIPSLESITRAVIYIIDNLKGKTTSQLRNQI